MTNHPNRNWRRRMEQAADQWQESSEGKVLAEVPMDFRNPNMLADGLRTRLRMAYRAGYQDGRKRDE